MEDDRYRACLVAGAVIVRAVGGLLPHDEGVAGLPQHGDIEGLSYWDLAYLACDLVPEVTRVSGLFINLLVLEVNQRSSNLSVDERFPLG
jgi:hypothetical protein